MAILTASAAGAASAAPIEGHWANPKESVVVNVAPCGNAYCGTVIRASAKAQDDAEEGGTDRLIGTRLMNGFTADGRGGYRGRIFLPKRNMHAGGTIRMLGPNQMVVKGCAFAGMLCRDQNWHRVR